MLFRQTKKYSFFTVKNFAEQKFQVQINGEMAHFSDPAVAGTQIHRCRRTQNLRQTAAPKQTTETGAETDTEETERTLGTLRPDTETDRESPVAGRESHRQQLAVVAFR